MRLVMSFVVAVVISTAADTAAPPSTFEEAEAAYIALDFDRALEGYKRVAADASLTAKDRTRAYRQLGVLSWRLKGDEAASEESFRSALDLAAEMSPTEVERSRMLRENGRFPEAIAAAESAVSSAQNEAEKLKAVLAFSRSVLESLEKSNLADQAGGDRGALDRARELLRTYENDTPLPLDISEAMLGVGLRLGDGKLALLGWKSYAREGAETGTWKSGAQKLSEALPRWTGEPSPELREAIFDGLRESQFFDFAALVATDERFDDIADFVKTPQVAETIAYAEAENAIRDTTDAYYRDIANRKGDAKVWRAAIGAIGKRLWDKLPFGGERPKFSEAMLSAELRKRFGAEINLGETGGVADLHYGHIFVDDAREVEQYGHKAKVRLVSLDRLVSNGYESWVWDGRQAHGGWADAEKIIIVRPGYADGALRVWSNLTDPAQRSETEEKIKRLSAGDDASARKDRGAFLPGLSERLEWQGYDALLSRLRSQGLSGGALKQAFVIQLNRIQLDSSIFAHEGRHVLDKVVLGDKLSSEEMEYRAKLSEVAFCEQPQICFGSIFNANISDATSPHGRANKRITEQLLGWMESHKAEIKGLDLSRPLLPQFDMLTDDQIRAAMRSLDPWAKS